MKRASTVLNFETVVKEERVRLKRALHTFSIFECMGCLKTPVTGRSNKLNSKKKSLWSWYLLNNIAENNTIGTTQFRSIRNPNTRFPIKAPPLPNVSDRAAAMTLKASDRKTSIRTFPDTCTRKLTLNSSETGRPSHNKLYLFLETLTLRIYKTEWDFALSQWRNTIPR